jgi:glycosyltransferase involved in cell wall biosynthesis
MDNTRFLNNTHLQISIITVTYNSSQYLEQTIQSLISQTYTNFEYIVIDGGSTDGTVEILKRYSSKIDRLVSEPDDGIADAMNKGIELATGEYIFFLHSDDYLLHPEVLQKVSNHLSNAPEIVLFDIYLEKHGKRFLSVPRGFTFWMNFKTGVFHQSSFCKRELFKKINKFDTQFEIAMDYDFFLRAYREKASVSYIDYPVSLMRLTGLSSKRDWPSLKERFLEERRIHFKNCHSSFMNIIYKFYWLLYLPYRAFRYKIHE